MALSRTFSVIINLFAINVVYLFTPALIQSVTMLMFVSPECSCVNSGVNSPCSMTTLQLPRGFASDTTPPSWPLSVWTVQSNSLACRSRGGKRMWGTVQKRNLIQDLTWILLTKTKLLYWGICLWICVLSWLPVYLNENVVQEFLMSTC